MSRISINSNGDALRDAANYIAFCKALKPPALLQIENSGLAQQLAAALPETKVILRRYPDPTPGSDAAAWVNTNADFASGGLWLNALNEPGYSQKSIDWCVKAMDAALEKNVRLVVGNFGVGAYEPVKVAMLKPVLERCVTYPDKFALGLHEYFAGHIASGLGGGREAEMIQPESWPRGINAKLMTRWHVGRHKFICDWARENGYGDAKIVITEFGADRLRDVAAWQQSLIKTPPYDQIRGYHTLKAQWMAWYTSDSFKRAGKMETWDVAQIYYEMLRYADENLLDEMVEAACIFAWNTNPDWVQFDISGDAPLQKLLLEGATEPAPPPEPVPVPVPTPEPQPDDKLQALVAALRQMNEAQEVSLKAAQASLEAAKTTLAAVEAVTAALDKLAA